MLSVLNTNPDLNHLEQPMFYGEETGLARFESQKHRVFDTLTERQLSFFWRPNEVDLSKDRIDYKKLPLDQRIMFDSNLQYQSLLDTVQGRAPNIALLPVCSDVALETWISTWAFSETIHSRSYTHIERNLHIDPSVEFDKIMRNEAIMKRCDSITGYYDRLMLENHKLAQLDLEIEFIEKDISEFMREQYEELFGSLTLSIKEKNRTEKLKEREKQLRECKKALYLCMHSINALEAIRFYVSFSFTFNFAENGVMEGNAKIMKLIARDEALHQKGTQNIIRLMQMGKDDPEMVDISKECEQEATQIFLDVYDQEIEWAQHLFSIGDVDGLSLKSTTAYIEHLTDHRMRSVGLKSPFTETSNPYPWMNKWLKSDEVQVAPQEIEVDSYLVGNLNTEISDENYASWRNEFHGESTAWLNSDQA